MKKVMIIVIILIHIMVYHACKNNNEDSLVNSSAITKQSEIDDDAKNFMKLASESGIMEVEFSRVAKQRSSSPEVRRFAETMITDHIRIYNELKKLASEKHLLLPIEMNPIQTNQLEKMKELNSIKFDQKYMLLMVKSHQKALNTYKIGLNNKDLAVNKFAKEKIIHLRDHLDSASSIFNKVIITHQ